MLAGNGEDKACEFPEEPEDPPPVEKLEPLLPEFALKMTFELGPLAFIAVAHVDWSKLSCLKVEFSLSVAEKTSLKYSLLKCDSTLHVLIAQSSPGLSCSQKTFMSEAKLNICPLMSP